MQLMMQRFGFITLVFEISFFVVGLFLHLNLKCTDVSPAALHSVQIIVRIKL